MHPIDKEYLFGLDINELEAVSEDIELYFRKYQFYFAIDAYDLVHFFFPYLDTLQFTEENVRQLAMEGIAYDTFFSNTATGAIVLLEEYKDELAIVRDLFIQKMKRAYELTQNIDKLALEFLQLKETGKKLEEIAYTNPELCFLLLVFLQRREVKELSFAQFFKKKVFLNGFTTEDDEFNLYSDEAFSQPYDRNFVTTIFEQFRELQREKTRNMSTHVYDRYLYNTYKDIVAIEKVLTANKMILDHEKYRNTVFYYLSSTPTKSALLFHLINKTYGDEMPYREHFKSGRSVHRNIQQAFLFTMLVAEYPDSKEMPEKMLKLLMTYRMKGGEYASVPVNEEDRQVVEALDKLIGKVSSNIQNHLLSSIFKNYQTTIDGIALGGSREVVNFTKNVLKKFETIQLEQDSIMENDYLRYNISKHGQLMLLKQAVTNEEAEKIMVTVRPGRDIVRLNFHHLPFLLFVYERDDWKKLAAFYTAMKAISEIISEKIVHIQPVIGFLKDLFLWWQSTEIRQRTRELLMSIYIDLLSVQVFTATGDPEIEVKLIAMLEQRTDTLLSQLRSNKKRKQIELLRNELYYVLIWLYRRCLQFDKLQKLEEDITVAEIWDARIFHGLGLGYESLFYHQGKKTEDKWMLEKSIKYLEGAAQDYGNLLGQLPSQFADIRNLVIKSLIGIGNSNCDSRLRLYDFDKQGEHIYQARAILSEMKDYTEVLEIDYNSVPIINHTEAELEYYEALMAYEKKDLVLAKKKITYALRRFQRCIDRASLMSEESKLIGERIVELRNRIFSHS
ncbi:hypothetical protein A3860_36445 [Niastella vici]|uniref:Uncharacterized protein n=1 Tax=Niastella vici TaxID=1703345 RepID=A0A1V9FMU8_9BACT|nr:hypothetical protein [Niastella vici]OQP59662.1 hypothetical protein A3860_36445 [Niastella vici]